MKHILLAILPLGIAGSLISCADDVAVRYHTYSDENVVYSEENPYYYPTYDPYPVYPYYHNESVVIRTDNHRRHHHYVRHHY